MFFSGPKTKLGIDIGTSSIKVVELKREGEQYLLETYGTVHLAYETIAKLEFNVIAETAGILRQLLWRAKVRTKKAVASLPNNIVFVTVIEVPPMSDRELKEAINWEAKRYVPLPIEEVTLSWSVVTEPERGRSLKVLLTAVPTTVIENYLKMFKLAGVEPQALEIEALALIRSLVGVRKDGFLIIDIGARNTSLNLIEKGFLRLSRNLTIGGETITTRIAESLHISFSRAEQFKKDMGLSFELQQIPQTIKSVLENLKNETLQLLKIFETSGGKIQEIIFTGGGARIPGILNYFQDLGVKAELGDPLKYVTFSPHVKEAVGGMAIDLSVALGLAMRN